jgi:uncharacterized protein YecE (DUF72 family)
MTSGKIHVGIGGWNYEPWRGVFFPPGLPHARELEYAAGAVTTIEINATYYRTQSPASFKKWAEATPPGFVFSLKASRFCSNRKNLAEAGQSIERFLGQGLTELGDRLGPILWQFMPTKRFNADEIAGFLALLPASRDGMRLRHAIEPRHESFRDPAFIALARKANIAIVFADSATYPSIGELTGDFVYARLQNAREEIETGYDAAELAKWANTACSWAGDGREVFIFMINGAKLRAPAAAQALIARLGA